MRHVGRQRVAPLLRHDDRGHHGLGQRPSSARSRGLDRRHVFRARQAQHAFAGCAVGEQPVDRLARTKDRRRRLPRIRAHRRRPTARRPPAGPAGRRPAPVDRSVGRATGCQGRRGEGDPDRGRPSLGERLALVHAASAARSRSAARPGRQSHPDVRRRCRSTRAPRPIQSAPTAASTATPNCQTSSQRAGTRNVSSPGTDVEQHLVVRVVLAQRQEQAR